MIFKKITIEVVMAVLWLRKLGDWRAKSKAYVLIVLLYLLMGQLWAQDIQPLNVGGEITAGFLGKEIYSVDTVKVQLWRFELAKPVFLMDTLIRISSGVLGFKAPKVEGNFYLKVSEVKNKKVVGVIIKPLLMNGVEQVLVDVKSRRVSNGRDGVDLGFADLVDLEFKLELDSVDYAGMSVFQRRIYVLKEKLKKELFLLEGRKEGFMEEVYAALCLDLVALNYYHRLMACADVLKAMPLSDLDRDAGLGLIDGIIKDSSVDQLRLENSQYRKMLLKAMELKFAMSNSLADRASVDSMVLAHIQSAYVGDKRAWLWAHYFSLAYARMSPREVVGLKRKFNDGFAALLPREVVLAVNRLGFQSDETFWFSLVQHSGKVFKLKEFLGKVVLIDFWYTGCSNCIDQHKKVLTPLHEKLGKDKAFGFIDVSIDKAVPTWKRSIASAEYTLTGAVHVYTEGLGSNHPLIKHYNISGYPSTIVIDKYGRSYNVNHIASDVEKLGVFLESLKNQ